MNSAFLWVLGIAMIVAIVFLFRRFQSHEVGELEHQDAARFARLLIAQIKLYESFKLERGIKQNNIYGSLQGEIEQARREFNARVPSKDLEHYFDDEVVELLADGDLSKMGGEYARAQAPGVNT